MNKHCALVLLAAALAAAAAGSEPLFNGKDLEGWDGDPRLCRVENGMILGSTEGVELEANSFLITRRRFKNFHLGLEAKLRNHNSGIQFRSEALDGWVVRGLQADMAEDNWWGSIYDERGTRGVIVNGWKGKAETVVRRGDWNRYEVLAQDDLIQLRVNGLLTAELKGEPLREGVIALQLHRGPPMEVRFRNIRIRVLD